MDIHFKIWIDIAKLPPKPYFQFVFSPIEHMSMAFPHILAYTYVMDDISSLDRLPSLDRSFCHVTLQPLPPEDQRCSPLLTVSLPVDLPWHSGALTLALEQALTALGSFLALSLRWDSSRRLPMSWRAVLAAGTLEVRKRLRAPPTPPAGRCHFCREDDPSCKQSFKALALFCSFTSLLFNSRFHLLSLNFHLNRLTLQPTFLCLSVWYQAEKLLWPLKVETAVRSPVITHCVETGAQRLCSPFPPRPFLQAPWGRGCRVWDLAEPTTPSVSILSSWPQPPWDLPLDWSTPVGMPGSQGGDWGGWGRARESGEQRRNRHSLPRQSWPGSSPHLSEHSSFSSCVSWNTLMPANITVVVVIIIIWSFSTISDALGPAFRLGGRLSTCQSKSVWTSVQSRAKPPSVRRQRRSWHDFPYFSDSKRAIRKLPLQAFCG